jgi:hypothetical protein
MTESSLPVQDVVLAALTAALAPTPVYDNVPQNTAPLYVQIGEGSSTPDTTKAASGQNELVEVNIFSTHRGFLEVKQTARKIKDALHRKTLYPAGTQRVIPEFEFSDFFREPDGPRGVMRFRIQT